MKCQACNAENRAGRKFCAGCGAPLQVVTKVVAPPERNLRTYTSKYLAEKILQSRSALANASRSLFADVKGSMELAEQLDPEEWHKIRERFFEILTDHVFHQPPGFPPACVGFA